MCGTGRKSAVYYRYGSYVNRREGAISVIIDSVGKAHPDKRALSHVVPNWLKDPINKRPIKRCHEVRLACSFWCTKLSHNAAKEACLRRLICQICHRASSSSNKADGMEI